LEDHIDRFSMILEEALRMGVILRVACH